MRLSEFWNLAGSVFGDAYARTLAADQVLMSMDGRTAEQALRDGIEPRDVYVALCDAMDVPESRRWPDLRRRPGRPA